MTRRVAWLTIGLALAVGAVLAVGVAGCGSDDEQAGRTDTAVTATAVEEPVPGSGRRLIVTPLPDGSPGFEQGSLEGPSGEVAIELRNRTETPHSICVSSAEVGTLGCTPEVRGDRVTLRLELEPGAYELFCNAEGHREAGMTIPLTID